MQNEDAAALRNVRRGSTGRPANSSAATAPGHALKERRPACWLQRRAHSRGAARNPAYSHGITQPKDAAATIGLVPWQAGQHRQAC